MAATLAVCAWDFSGRWQADIRHPVFAVLGNHDTKSPGPDLTGPLRDALRTHGVRLIEGEVVAFKGWQLAGLSDLWGGRPQDEVRALWPQGQAAPPRLVLVHQPDTMNAAAAGRKPFWRLPVTPTAVRSGFRASRPGSCARPTRPGPGSTACTTRRAGACWSRPAWAPSACRPGWASGRPSSR
jgi:hypothetical protein